MKKCIGLIIVISCWASFAHSKFNSNYEAMVKTFSDEIAQQPKVTPLVEQRVVEFLAVTKKFQYASEAWYRFYPSKKDILLTQQQTEANYYHTKCTVDKISEMCSRRDRKIEELKLSGSRSFQPVVIDIPKIDKKNMRVTTTEGQVFDFRNGDEINPKAVGTTQDLTGPNVKSKGKGGTNERETSDSDLKCDWSADLPRKVVRGPGCYVDGTRICTGYINCTGKIKIDRLATCSESLCGEGQALACARQRGFGSKSPGTDNQTFTNKVDGDTDSGKVTK